MAKANDTDGKDLRARLFSWYWARQTARAKDAAKLRRDVLARRAELDKIAERIERRIAHERLADEAVGDSRWITGPAFLSAPVPPRVWREPATDLSLGEGLTVFHDFEGGAFILSQRPNRARAAKRRYELFFESYEFQGSYLSFVVNVPAELKRPSMGERVVTTLEMRASRPVKAFLRLNINGARGQDTLYAEGEVGVGRSVFDFDMSFATYEMGPSDGMWLDLIIDRPRMVEFSIEDLTIALLGGKR
ncbi:MAG: DUF6478 family protein [Pikeienuella sp.]